MENDRREKIHVSHPSFSGGTLYLENHGNGHGLRCTDQNFSLELPKVSSEVVGCFIVPIFHELCRVTPAKDRIFLLLKILKYFTLLNEVKLGKFGERSSIFW